MSYYVIVRRALQSPSVSFGPFHSIVDARRFIDRFRISGSIVGMHRPEMFDDYTELPMDVWL